MSSETAHHPLVSVIIPVFNSEAYISETIQSVLVQTYRHIEIIVIDDGSTDRSREIITRYPQVMYHYRTNSGSPSIARNDGIARAHGSLVTFLDSDDIYLPDKIRQQVAFLDRNPGLQIVACNYTAYSDNHLHQRSHFQNCPEFFAWINPMPHQLVLPGERVRHVLAQENFITTVSLMVRRRLIEELGAFDAGLAASEDYEYLYRVCLKYDLGLVKSVGFHRRLHDDNLTKDGLKMSTANIASHLKLLRLEKSKPIRRLLKKALSVYHLQTSEINIGRNYTAAIIHCWKSFRYWRSWRAFRKFAKVILSFLNLLPQGNRPYTAHGHTVHPRGSR